MRDEIDILLKEYEVGRVSRRVFVQSLAAFAASPSIPLVLGTAAVATDFAMAQEPSPSGSKGKTPSRYTVQAQQQQRKILPLADKQDFAEAKRGFIAAPAYRKIMNDKGDVVWNMDNWNFLLSGKDYDSIHPSLRRQATLTWNMASSR